MSLIIRSYILMALMLMSAGLAQIMRPAYNLDKFGSGVDINTMIPLAFSGWREEVMSFGQIVNPQQKEVIEEIYDQTLSRTYVNTNGDRIMLSIAYGRRQDKQSQVHRPEVCYPAQGFSVSGERRELIVTPYGTIPVQRLVAKLNDRVEPITYWVRIGDDLANGWLSQKIAVVKQSLHGQVADGLLFRVSSLSEAPHSAYSLQDQFIVDVLKATAITDRHFFIGQP